MLDFLQFDDIKTSKGGQGVRALISLPKTENSGLINSYSKDTKSKPWTTPTPSTKNNYNSLVKSPRFASIIH